MKNGFDVVFFCSCHPKKIKASQIAFTKNTFLFIKTYF
ncbi:Hypothetical protein I595_1668 [Croceitalea dokdonensis DOKDO 023]|uniref:Uncharacterized protein n=1 Tax=Croceitalea dokdonensis DOKDO 023 TaxID=1300341 RepID=A0A0P7AZL7_9FLAO|nr:Hypothetical protein I595_1668 [Croceitalea dokdonensis DOKDO 023]